VKAARSYVQSGKRVVVDVDLAKFFDRVNHDILIARLSGRIDDAGVIRLIRAYLNAGIMDGGLVIERHLGTPQGGPLNPLLANVLLDDVDKALEARGYCFARYADDCNVYVGSRKAGERVMALLRRLYAGLKLSDQRSQERGGQRLRAQVPGLRSVGGQGQRSQMQGGRQGAGQLQGPNKATHAPLGRPQPWTGCGLTCWVGRRISAWRKRPGSGESWTSGCATDCGRSGSYSGNGRRRSTGNSGCWAHLKQLPAGGGQLPPLVAQQRVVAQQRADNRLLRPAGSSPIVASELLGVDAGVDRGAQWLRPG
jgi:hypothetical protein